MNEFFCSSVIGYRHIKANTPKEDYGCISETEFCKIFVMGDGHGDPDCFRSNVGSEMICRVSVEALAEFAENAAAEEVLDEYQCRKKVYHLVKVLFGKWKGAVLQQLEENPYTETELAYMDEQRQKGSGTVAAYDSKIQLEHIFGTTLIAGVMTDKYLLLLHQGDGRCTVMYEDGTYDEPVPWDDRCYDVYTTSVCDEDAIDSCRYKVFDLQKQPIIACLLSSDGVEDQFSVDSDLVHSYFDELILYGIENGKDALCAWLDQDSLPVLTKNGNGDDITVCGFYDPQKIEGFKDLFIKRKAIIRTQDKLDNVKFYLDSIARSPKMGILKKVYEDAQAECDRLQARYEQARTELENVVSDLLAFSNTSVESSDLKAILARIFKIVQTGNARSDKTQQYYSEINRIKQEKDTLTAELESAKAKLEKAKGDYDSYRQRYDDLLAQQAELEKELAELKAE